MSNITRATAESDMEYMTGRRELTLFSGEMLHSAFPLLKRTIVKKSRTEHVPALAPLFAGFITDADKKKITPKGYDVSDVPDNLTDALNWRGRSYMNRRYLVSLFLRWTLLVVTCYFISELSLALDSPDNVYSPGDVLLTIGSGILSLIGLAFRFAIYPITLAYLLRVGTLLAKKNLTAGAQLWLAQGNPVDPIRLWNRRYMLDMEKGYTDTTVVGQTAHVVLTTHNGSVVSDSQCYRILDDALAPAYYNRGVVSGADRLALATADRPTVISGGVGNINANSTQGDHLVLYVLGVRNQRLIDTDYALRSSYLDEAVSRVARINSSIGGYRIYMETDPEFYDCVINDNDSRRSFFRSAS